LVEFDQAQVASIPLLNFSLNLYFVGQLFMYDWMALGPITVAARSKEWTVFARLNAGILGTSPTQSIYVCVCLFCVYVVLWVGWSPVKGVLPTVYRIK
jgi:hypothetical protein